MWQVWAKGLPSSASTARTVATSHQGWDLSPFTSHSQSPGTRESAVSNTVENIGTEPSPSHAHSAPSLRKPENRAATPMAKSTSSANVSTGMSDERDHAVHIVSASRSVMRTEILLLACTAILD